MRKLLLLLIVIFIVGLAGIYAFIPYKITFSTVAIFKAKINIVNRFLMDSGKWQKWFPHVDAKDNISMAGHQSAFRYKNYNYSIERHMMNAAEISISNREASLKSLLNMISVNNESVAIEWRSELPGTSDPVRRVKSFIRAKRIQKSMSGILQELQAFLSTNDNVYGMHIHEIISKDSTLLATKTITNGYPLTKDIYAMVAKLQEYIARQGASENNLPMLHVKQVSDTTFESMVAIPVNKALAGNDTLFFRRFVPWKVLTAEVKGGTYTVTEALHQMETYIADNHREAMAIPFQSLVTDRSRQPDTLQWITSVITPVR